MREFPATASSSDNIYAYRKRLVWMRRHLKPADRIVERGCGTGYMVTLPLLADGYDITDLDRDEDSVAYGCRLAEQAGLAGGHIVGGDLDVLQGQFVVVLASEVLEHLDETQLDAVLASVRNTLRPGGLFLVTVPNGFGWFEFESWIWNRLRLGMLLSRTRLDRTLMRIKVWLSGKPEDELVEQHPSSLDTSPHVQRFTLSSLRRCLSAAGFEVIESTGSALFAGQISNLLFTGYEGLVRLNAGLAGRLPALSSGFYVACARSGSPVQTAEHE